MTSFPTPCYATQSESEVRMIRRQMLRQNYVQARGRKYVRKAQNAQTIKLELDQ